MITKQVHSDKTGPRSSPEVNPKAGGWVNRVCDQTHGDQCSYSIAPVDAKGPRMIFNGSPGKTRQTVAPGEADQDH